MVFSGGGRIIANLEQKIENKIDEFENKHKLICFIYRWWSEDEWYKYGYTKDLIDFMEEAYFKPNKIDKDLPVSKDIAIMLIKKFKELNLKEEN